MSSRSSGQFADVTVLMIVYNSDMERITKTLNSVVIQEGVRVQIIVADDGSKENHRDEIDDYLKKNNITDYQLVMNEQNGGTVKNVISGLKFAEGKYTKLISPGDMLAHPRVLREWIDFLETQKKDWSFSDAEYYRLNNGKEEPIRAQAYPKDIRPYLGKNDFRKRWYYVVLLDIALGAAIFSTTDTIRKVCGRICDKGVKYAEDYMWRVLMFEGNIGEYYPEIMVRYEYGTGISTKDDPVWNERIEYDIRKSNEVMRDTPNPDAFQKDMLNVLFSGKRLWMCKHKLWAILYFIRIRFFKRQTAI